ncbi:spermatogenesis-associated protein 1 isoform X2 [Antennarius striatus]|uniref:spermatogenesis-associated protein 1 isoform X2 n=1 Tax=Antennarius striatus TaxID=241820 RepID=UPI0035B388C3
MMMELSCESVRYPEDRRPASCKFVELHVLYVPDDQWDVKLNKIPADTIESFISAGFIRVYPDITLKTLRSNLGHLLGSERSIDKFSFLKCVGRSLALVKSKQERDLKVKTFAPPYAPQPELYLLPTMENSSSVGSQSFTPDTSSSSSDHRPYYHTPQTCNQPAGTKGPIKFPLIPKCSHQPPPTQSLEEGEEEEEEEEGEDEEQCFSTSEAEGENEDEDLSAKKLEWADQECCSERLHHQRPPQSVTQNKGKSKVQQHKASSGQVKDIQEREEAWRKKKQHHRENRAVREPGVVPSLEERDSDFCLTDRIGNSKDPPKTDDNPTSEVTENPLSLSVQCTSPRGDLPSDAVTQKASAFHVLHTNREELIEEIKLVRDQRKQLEWMRQELLRKGKDLLSQNRHRRNQARDSWKKKYFETKKATIPLEESLRTVREELETFYNKLLHQLQARDNRGKSRRQGRSSLKNELIIQIMTESYVIDNLKRKIEDAKMKLVTEIKLRKQAATELRDLKAELAQKKSQLCQDGATRERTQLQGAAI